MKCNANVCLNHIKYYSNFAKQPPERSEFNHNMYSYATELMIYHWSLNMTSSSQRHFSNTQPFLSIKKKRPLCDEKTITHFAPKFSHYPIKPESSLQALPLHTNCR